MTLTFAEIHNMIAYLTKSDGSEGFNQIINFLNGSLIKYALTVNLNIYVSCIKQFWTTVVVKKVNDVTRLQALMDKKKVVVTESTIRDALCWMMQRVLNVSLMKKSLQTREGEEGDADENVENVNAGDPTEGDVSAANDEVPIADEEPSIPSPTTPTPLPQPSHDIPSTSQVQPTPPQSPQAQQPTPQPQPQPLQDAGLPIDLLQNLLDTCTTLTRRVEHLEQDKIAQDLEITKLKQRVKKLEKRNKVNVLNLRRLQKVGSTQRIDTSDDTVKDDVSNQGKMIADMDADANVGLEESKDVAADVKDGQDVDVQDNANIQERIAES
nr:hypothetical protein [Tanacetum cinerariifolium]